MSWLERPAVWFTLTIIVLAAVGGLLLNRPACKTLSERDWQAYGNLNAWQAHFDALSAVCGVGLLTCYIDDTYTPTGRWALIALGLCGAFLHLLAARQIAARWWRPASELPGGLAISLAFLTLCALSVPLVALLEWVAVGATTLPGAAQRAISAFASLGWSPGSPGREYAWIYALVAFAGAVGWAVWLLPIRPWGGAIAPHTTRIVVQLTAYAAFMISLAALVTAMELPRGGRESRRPSDRLSTQSAGQRFARSLVQVACASGAGIPTEELSEKEVTDGTKVALAVALAVGPLGGSAGGGTKFTLFLFTGYAVVSTLSRRRPAEDPTARRYLLAGVTCTAMMLLLIAVTAFGLLIIEARTASPYQPPPTFADALLDASSAAAGGNLSSGILQTVTHRKLSRGIRQHVDLYQYGMVWLMMAMLVGRVLPLVVLCRMATIKPHETPVALPPLV